MTATRNLLSIHDTLAIKRSMEVRREEYLDYMTFRSNARPLFTEIFGPLIGLRSEWTAQGATPAELDFSAYRYCSPMWYSLPVNTGWSGGETEEILTETEDYLLGRDRMGRTVKLIKASASLALPLTHPVQNMDDWLKVKKHYAAGQYDALPYEDRFGANWEQSALAARAAGLVVSVSIPGGFDEPRQLMGEEATCLAFYEQPELLHDILNTISDTAYRVLDRVSAVITIDQLDVHEDFAGKSGPLIGPRQIETFIKPYYRRIWDMLAARGTRVFSIDSDGNINSVIPALLDAGINSMLPMEPAAHVDIVQIRQRYGRQLSFMGGIDKHVIRRSQDEITAELEYKIPPMIRTGGCILGLDHRIPNGTPLENYRFYIRKVWEILEREWNHIDNPIRNTNVPTN